MPSPFPGMDPYLEAPDLWPDVHHDLITQIRRQLMPRLRPKYFTKVEGRTFIPTLYDPDALHLIVPDIKIVEQREASPVPARGGGVATMAEVAEAVDIDALVEEELRESYIEVRETASRDLVTVIELVSPSNKVKGSGGWESFRQKHDECVAAGVNWLEIDLIRYGTRPTRGGALVGNDYRVLREWQLPERRRHQAWAWNLDRPIPVVGVPLRPEDGHVPLDLRHAIATTYDEAGYDLMIDYTIDPPEPKLRASTAAWVEQVVGKTKPPV